MRKKNLGKNYNNNVWLYDYVNDLKIEKAKKKIQASGYGQINSLCKANL